MKVFSPFVSAVRHHLACLLAAGLLVCGSPTLLASPQPDLERQIEALVKPSVASGARVSIQVGQLDPRLNLAPCAQAEPFVPAGARLWGRTAIGIRCVSGAKWSVTLPITVSVFAKALVSTRSLGIGASPAASDVVLQEIELTKESSQVATDITQLRGMSLSRGISPGQPILLEALRITPTVNQGDPLKVVVIGSGFSMSTEGQAVAAAGEGQTVRVKLESGKVVVGTLRGRTVEIGL